LAERENTNHLIYVLYCAKWHSSVLVEMQGSPHLVSRRQVRILGDERYRQTVRFRISLCICSVPN